MYVQDEGNVLLLSVGSIQRNLHWLLREPKLILAEEMHLNLIVENYERRKDSLVRASCLTCSQQLSYHYVKLV